MKTFRELQESESGQIYNTSPKTYKEWEDPEILIVGFGRMLYSQLKNKTTGDLYFSGFIARANLNYQFNPTLSFRLIGELNDFDKGFFFQPLLKWNPNPFTIFYIGGTNGYSRIENKNQYTIENSQLYLKFQNLFDW